MDTYSPPISGSLLQKLATAIVLAAAFFISAGIVVYLSLRSSEVEVPKLIGKTESDAEQALSAVGLRFKIRNRATDEKIQANLISEQVPSAGTTVKAGQLVSVTISTGIEAKEEEAAVKPTATPKPKPKLKPSPSPATEGDKTVTSGNEAKKTVREASNAANKAEGPTQTSNKGVSDSGQGKLPAPPVSKSKASPTPTSKASPKPVPKKTGTN